jgi:hypothetical protein
MKARGSTGNLELFSNLAHFLHFIGRRFTRATTAFSTFLSAKKGERCKKHPVHHAVHLRVHLTDSVSSTPMNNLSMMHRAFWSRHGRGVGWNDPTFCRTVRPNGFSGVVPAHTHCRKENMVLFPAI